MDQFENLNHLMELVGSPNLHDGMRLWFIQHATEDSSLGSLLFACCEHLRKVMTKNCVMMFNMETLVSGVVSVGCADAMNRTQERHRVMLGVLTNLLFQVQAGVHEEKGNATKMNQNN